MRIESVCEYDYEAQAWITGPRAVSLRVEHLRDIVALLLSEKGMDYAANIITHEAREEHVTVARYRDHLLRNAARELNDLRDEACHANAR